MIITSIPDLPTATNNLSKGLTVVQHKIDSLIGTYECSATESQNNYDQRVCNEREELYVLLNDLWEPKYLSASSYDRLSKQSGCPSRLDQFKRVGLPQDATSLLSVLVTLTKYITTIQGSLSQIRSELETHRAFLDKASISGDSGGLNAVLDRISSPVRGVCDNARLLQGHARWGRFRDGLYHYPFEENTDSTNVDNWM
jgi:hypothetical protein